MDPVGGAEAGAAEGKPSQMDLMTQLLSQQTALMERLLTAGPPLQTPGVSNDTVSAVNAPQAGGSTSGRARLPAAATQAPTLISTASLRDFEAWKNKFEGFCLLTGLEGLPPDQQRAALLSTLDDDWVRVVRFGLDVGDNASMSDVIDAMQAYLRRQRNIVIDRQEFHKRVQQPGESVDEFLCALREIASFCDFCDHCTDDRFRDHLVLGVLDEEARRRMLESPNLTLKKALDICRACECSAHDSAAIAGSGESLGRLSSYRRGRNSNRAAICHQCGYVKHADGQPCPAEGKECFNCGGSSHFSRACKQPGRGTLSRPRGGGPGRWNQQTPDTSPRGPLASDSRGGNRSRYVSIVRSDPAQRSPADAGGSGSRRAAIEPPHSCRTGQQMSVGAASHAAQHTVRHAAQHPEPGSDGSEDVFLCGVRSQHSPRVRLMTWRKDGTTGMMVWLPDSGAEVSVMSIIDAERLGMHREDLQPLPNRLYAADGRVIQCLGQCNVKLRLGNVTRTVKVSVVPRIHCPLLSWHDAVGFRILPAEFPAQICGVDSEMTTNEEQPLVSDAGGAATPLVANSYPGAVEQEHGEGTSRTTADSGRASEKRPPTWSANKGQPTEEDRAQHFSEMKQAFPRVFSSSDTLRIMEGEPMKIELREDAVPFAITAPRTIPFCWREQVKQQLDELLAMDVIEPVEEPSEWCHPLVPVAKRSADGTVSGCRITVDFTKLNKYVKRPVHPVRTPHDAVAAIPQGASYFTKLDAKSGYHQILVRPEDRHFLTFITPYGRFRCKRASMGLVSSGDEYNRRGDAVLGDIPHTSKVVDDILAFDSDYDEHLKHVWRILGQCDAHGITLNPQKCVFGARKVEFCGFEISAEGYTVDEKKLRAVAEFPRPENITDLRSFLGLTNQIGEFSPDVAAMAEPLRHLLKPKNDWLWTADHTKAFNDVKRALVSPPVLDFFHPGRRTVLETDAARLRGIGFCLRQQDEAGRWRLVQCGSRFLSKAEASYAVCEIEMLALAWACKKCAVYLTGMERVEVVVDHKPLVPIVNNKGLADIDNPRLQRLREKLLPYSLTASWREGKHHAAADALSRAPVDTPTADDVEMEKELAYQMESLVARVAAEKEEDGTSVSPFPDAALERVRAAAKADPECIALKEAIITGFPSHKGSLDPELRQFWGVRHLLAVDDGLVVYGQRLLIPKCLRRETLQKLHISHQGIERTKRRARQTVYWPGIDQDITNYVGACSVCQRHLPSHQKEPLIQESIPSRVFEAVSADYFAWAGRTYLVYADRLSGWASVVHVQGAATARDLIASLRSMFAATGVPNTIRTDGGPQFSAKLTRDFLRRWGVKHEISSPHYSQSHGHAEAAVKTVKHLVMKVTSRGDLDTDEFAQGLLELRNTPGADGKSPAEVLFGHQLRSTVPTHHRGFASRWQRAADDCDRRSELNDKVKQRYDLTAREHPRLRVRQRVLIQNPRTKLWDRTGEVTAVGRHRDYVVKMPSGRIYWRNRRFLRPLRPFATGQENISASSAPQQVAAQSPAKQMSAPSLWAPASPPSPAQAPVSPPKSVRFRGEGADKESQDHTTGSPKAPEQLPARRSRHPPDRLVVRWGERSYT